MLAIAGCASDPFAGYAPVPVDDLVPLVAGNSLLIDGTDSWPLQTQLFFAANGRGWRDGRLVPGTDPRPGDMAVLALWRGEAPNGVCLWSAPLIGEMPSFVPPHKECLNVWQTIAPPYTLLVTATDSLRSIRAPAALFPGNIFPPDRMAQYERQVRVLFGGQLPEWR